VASADAVTRHVVTFGRVLREAGLEIGPSVNVNPVASCSTPEPRSTSS